MSQEEQKRKRGRPRKYATPEEAHDAQLRQMKEWRKKHTKKITSPNLSHMRSSRAACQQTIYHLVYTFKSPDAVATYQGMIQALTSRELLPQPLDSFVKSEIVQSIAPLAIVEE